MPIVGRTPQECFGHFERHVRGLVASILGARPHIQGLQQEGGARLFLSFFEGRPIVVPVETRLGRLYFGLNQLLAAVPTDEGHRLHTLKYWYRLQGSADAGAQAYIRWEYDSDVPQESHCPHHVQIDQRIKVGTGTLDLDKAHVPTGRVTMEQVFRFLIVELGYRPLQNGWADVLERSERLFYERFTGMWRTPTLG